MARSKKRRQWQSTCAHPQHDPTGALTLFANDEVLEPTAREPTNAAQVLAGTHAAVYRPRQNDWDMPNAHANNAASAVVSIYRQEVTRHTDYTLASKALAKAILDWYAGLPTSPHQRDPVASSPLPDPGGRRYYCWLHGWNNSHDGIDCKVITNDTQYTAQMRNATSEIGIDASRGNLKIEVPVTYTRPSFFVHHITPSPCRALLVLVPPHTHTIPYIHSPLSSPVSRDSVLCQPY